ncbi:BSD domain-containing protein 1 [Porphyridium purpureum]|uniref:BSD domain-containing protein 1 n=1 Tax=Porphyridium purpureum TaxID=35688 RepID=A0A5J4YKN8_PORPP|nr:BSD domain-containing protein 1 [Porphyridium purpureum]|eukprot:POR2442..scf244_11
MCECAAVCARETQRSAADMDLNVFEYATEAPSDGARGDGEEDGERGGATDYRGTADDEDLDVVLERAAENLSSWVNAAYSRAPALDVQMAGLSLQAPTTPIEFFQRFTKIRAGGGDAANDAGAGQSDRSGSAVAGLDQNGSSAEGSGHSQDVEGGGAECTQSASAVIHVPDVAGAWNNIGTFWNSVKTQASAAVQQLGEEAEKATALAHSSSAQLTASGAPASHDAGENAVARTRFQQKIEALRGKPDVYADPVEDTPEFQEWADGFALGDAQTEESMRILEQYPAIAKMHDSMVPDIVDDELFWMRYFYAKLNLEKGEQRRLALLQAAAENVADNEEDIGWSDDEDEDGAGDQVGGCGDGGDGSLPARTDSAKQADSANTSDVIEENRTASDMINDDGKAGSRTQAPVSTPAKVSITEPVEPNPNVVGKANFPADTMQVPAETEEKVVDSDDDWE